MSWPKAQKYIKQSFYSNLRTITSIVINSTLHSTTINSIDQHHRDQHHHSRPLQYKQTRNGRLDKMCALIIELVFCKCTNTQCPIGPSTPHKHHLSRWTTRGAYIYCNAYTRNYLLRNIGLGITDPVPHRCPVVQALGEVPLEPCEESFWDQHDFCQDCQDAGCASRCQLDLDDHRFRLTPSDILERGSVMRAREAALRVFKQRQEGQRQEGEEWEETSWI